MYALIDSANFFVSCERVFKPSLLNIPVIVIGSNDGCAVARSDEAKRLGIPMGAPLFKIKEIVAQHQVRVLSGNMLLYADMSRRVMDTIQHFVGEVEQYSIDECFVKLPSSKRKEDYLQWAVDLRQKILQWTGIPTRVGIGPTKTLAKLSNHHAKGIQSGVYYTDSNDAETLHKTPVEDIWGIGPKTAVKLRSYGVGTALDFIKLPDALIRKWLTVMGLKTAHELRGYPVFSLETQPEAQQSMIVSRSFGKEVFTKEDLTQSIIRHCHKAGESLRKRELWTRYIGVHIRTNPFKGNYYSQSDIIEIPHPTQDTQVLIESAKKVLEKIYRPGCAYKKSGICLEGLSDESSGVQLRLGESSSPKEIENRNGLMKAMDIINQKMGKHTVYFGEDSQTAPWLPASTNKSQDYTCNWKELPKVK